jgi:hypothetical protein
MTDCAPIVCGTEGLTVDVKVAPMLDEWEAPTVDEVDAPSKLEGVPNMVETMALIEDIVGVAPTSRLGLLVCGGGVNPMVDGVKAPTVSGLRISVVKDIVEAAVEEVDPSIRRSGVVSPNVGLSRSKYGKEGVIPFASLEKVVEEVDILRRENQKEDNRSDYS